MGAPKKKDDPPPAGAPLYMVSFGDMMTIMLTFFILLCSYATERQAGFVSDGVGSFKNSVNSMGMPGVLPADKHPVDLGARKVRYKPVGAVNSTLVEDAKALEKDYNRDSLRDVVKDALKKDDVTRVPVELIFGVRDTKLSDEHREALDVMAPLVQGKNLQVRLEGYAFEEADDPRETRAIAFLRAAAVGDYLTGVHGIARTAVSLLGYGSGGKGPQNRENRVVQDRLGRRIVLLYLVPPEE